MNAEQFKRRTNISPETLAMYQSWYTLLNHWNKKINLVATSTLHDFWLRHALDSWQLVALLPAKTKTILDMGAGAGFPGLAIAISLKQVPAAQVTLVEANAKKCNFLRTVIRELGLPAQVVQTRVEALPPKPYDLITARAFAPLPKLLNYSLPFWDKRHPKGTSCGARRGSDSDRPENKMHTAAIFPKGERWQGEVEQARQTYNFDLTTTTSQTNDQAKILQITNLHKKSVEQ